MPKIQIQVPHELERETVMMRLQSFSVQVRRELGDRVDSIHEQWTAERMDFVLKAKGTSISGNLIVTHESVDVETQLPFVALPFRGMLETFIRNAIDRAIAE